MIELVVFGILLFLIWRSSKQNFQYLVGERDKHLNSVLGGPNPNRVLDPESYLVPGFYTHGYYFDIKNENKRWEDWTFGQKYAKIAP